MKRAYVFAAISALALLAANSATASASEPAPRLAQNFEIRYMERTLEHHTMGIAMAEMCVQEATFEELRALCAENIEAQSAERAQLMTWLQSWYGIEFTADVNAGGAMRRLERLQEAKFDIEFMRTFSKHHLQMVDLSEKCLVRAIHPELLDLCLNIVSAQSQDVADMQNWLCERYDRCRGFHVKAGSR